MTKEKRENKSQKKIGKSELELKKKLGRNLKPDLCKKGDKSKKGSKIEIKVLIEKGNKSRSRKYGE